LRVHTLTTEIFHETVAQCLISSDLAMMAAVIWFHHHALVWLRY